MIRNTRHKDLIIAWLNGAEIEVFKQATKRWEMVHSPSFIEEYDYRIKSKEPFAEFPGRVVDYFNLTLVVPEDAKWLACDEDGEVYAYSSKPHLDLGNMTWYADENCKYWVHSVSSSPHGVESWEETLVEIDNHVKHKGEIA